jgi:predicted dehydrogenase
MSEGLGVAVIGAGAAGRAHAYGYRAARSVFSRELGGLRLVSIADVLPEAAQDAAHRYGFEKAVTSWQEVAEDDDVDVVSVVVANPLHREIVCALLARGKHVLCEKPLAPTVADAEAMIAAEDASSALARVGFTFRFTPGVRAIRDLVTSGALGAPVHFSGRYWADYGSDPEAPLAWRYRGGPGTGVLADTGSHMVDTAEFLCGPVASVSGASFATTVAKRPVPAGHVSGHGRAETSGEVGAVENEDTAAYTARFESGATGTVAASRVAAGHPNTYTFELLCERGGASYDARTPSEFLLFEHQAGSDNNGFRRVLLGSQHRFVGGGLPFDGAGIGFGHNDAFVFQARSFLDEIEGRSELPRCMPLSHGLHNLRIQEAVVASAADGGTADVAS